MLRVSMVWFDLLRASGQKCCRHGSEQQSPAGLCSSTAPGSFCHSKNVTSPAYAQSYLCQNEDLQYFLHLTAAAMLGQWFGNRRIWKHILLKKNKMEREISDHKTTWTKYASLSHPHISRIKLINSNFVQTFLSIPKNEPGYAGWLSSWWRRSSKITPVRQAKQGELSNTDTHG